VTVYVVTTTWMPSEESDDFGGVDCHPINAMRVFDNHVDARTYAKEQVAENNLHGEDDLEADAESERGIVLDANDGWVIRNDYDYVFVDIHAKDVQ